MVSRPLSFSTTTLNFLKSSNTSDFFLKKHIHVILEKSTMKSRLYAVRREVEEMRWKGRAALEEGKSSYKAQTLLMEDIVTKNITPLVSYLILFVYFVIILIASC